MSAAVGFQDRRQPTPRVELMARHFLDSHNALDRRRPDEFRNCFVRTPRAGRMP